ncbi:hypothetical protein C4D60_Mb09t04620 [Musa balbisiana]|uniref:Uncharacterized protein n=1 Tax=Musa balbisiana TaxID=52838 RepID=A0A4S8IE05_MUSBA|nr:hypothetical protein C4D60_Mb09t04620 [Musa balbisiana]
MSKIKGLKAFIGLITHGRHSQNMILSSANRTSSFSYQCLVRSVPTSEHTNGKISATVASDEKNGTGDSDQTASQKPVRGGKQRQGMEVVPVFISVDPERDNVEQVHEYVKEFHPDLIGLTGTADEIRQVARAFRVYYMKTEEEGSDYLVDHSIVMYLMNPNMEFVKFFGKNYDANALTEGVIKEIKAG